MNRHKRFTIDEVKKIFKDQGCELLESKFINSNTPMKYKCNCGKINSINLSNFKNGSRCKKCGTKKQAQKMRYDIKVVKKCFKDNNCELLENEYKNIFTPMKYKCECGNISKINFYNFKIGGRCFNCGIKKHSGKNSPSYNPNLTDEDRRKYRNDKKELKDFRNGVYKRDNYICQKCRIRGGKLNAHHMASWNRRKDLRYDVDNGITLCKKCHKEFHSIHGKCDNYKCQTDVFLNTNLAVFDFGNEGNEKYIYF